MLRTKARGGPRRAERSPRILGIFGLLVLVAGCSGAADDGGEGDDGTKNGAEPGVSSFADAQVYVDAHNAVRAAVKEPAGYSGSWQSVPPVAWSDEVATTALAWAKHLRDTKDCGLEHAAGSGYGENLAAGTNVDAERAVDMWASEIDDYSYSPEYAFENDTGHYTQIVWRGTEHIGCASAACSGSNVVVCRYDPPGNYLGQKIY
jgi:pathogenesis-related protein 1